MGRRGTFPAIPRRAPSRGPEPVVVTVVRPERYMETLLQNISREIRTVRMAAPWHFEARRFLFDLKKLLEVFLERPRGA